MLPLKSLFHSGTSTSGRLRDICSTQSQRKTLLSAVLNDIPLPPSNTSEHFLRSVHGKNKRILTLSYIFNDSGIGVCLFFYFTQSGLFVRFPFFNCTFRKYPAVISVFIAFVQQQYLPSVNYDTSTACCLCHCSLQSSCLNAILGLSRKYYNVNGNSFQHWILLSLYLPEISVKYIFCDRRSHTSSGSSAFYDNTHHNFFAVVLRTADKPCVGVLIAVVLCRTGLPVDLIS